jgi:hypothetical protein
MEVAQKAGLNSINSVSVNKAGIHRILMNPIYHGEFVWKGKRYLGRHSPIIPKLLFETVQEVLHRDNHPQTTKRNFAFAGFVKCGKCGCSMTPELKKGKYIYYHCTGFKGKCDNTYIREDKLSDLFLDAVKQLEIEDELVIDIKEALGDSHKDKMAYHCKALNTLNMRAKHIQKLIDKAYDDKLTGVISEEFWERKSLEWHNELTQVNGNIGSFNNANVN